MTETLLLSLHIARRNWVVYRKDFLANISPSLSDPLFMVFSLGVGLGAMVPPLEGRSYLEFMAPGLVSFTALVTSFFECSYGFYIRMTFENVFLAMLTTPLGVREILIGEFIWVGLKGAVMGTCVAIFLALFGAFQVSWFALLIPVVGFFVGIGCGAMGLIASACVRNINQFQTVYAWIISPLLFFSGIFFPIEQMPKLAQVITWCLPLSHGVRLSQLAFWQTLTWSSFFFHGSVLLGQCLILSAIGYRLCAKRLRP